MLALAFGSVVAPNKICSPSPEIQSLNTLSVLPAIPLAVVVEADVLDGTQEEGTSVEAPRRMFIVPRWERPFAQTWMSHFYQASAAGRLHTGALLLSPVEHVPLRPLRRGGAAGELRGDRLRLKDRCAEGGRTRVGRARLTPRRGGRLPAKRSSSA